MKSFTEYLVESPVVMYHGTSTKEVEPLVKSGFRAADYPFLTDNPTVARGWAEMRVDNRSFRGLDPGKPVVLAVTVDANKVKEGAYRGIYSYPEAIPASRVKKSSVQETRDVQTFADYITELFGSPAAFRWVRQGSPDYRAEFTVGDVEYHWFAEWNSRIDAWEVAFHMSDESVQRKGVLAYQSFGVTGTGNEFAVFATAIAIMKDFIRRENPNVIKFSAYEYSRRKLYTRFIQSIQRELPGYVGETHVSGNAQIYTISKVVTEAFMRAKSDLQSTPGYLYHATNEENAEDIARMGLKPHVPDYGTDQSAWPDGRTEPRIYFGKQAHQVWMFAPEHGRSVVLRVKIADGEFRNEVGTGDVYSRKPIPATKIEILQDDGRWVPLKSAF